MGVVATPKRKLTVVVDVALGKAFCEAAIAEVGSVITIQGWEAAPAIVLRRFIEAYVAGDVRKSAGSSSEITPTKTAKCGGS